jgi:hypothetical protein
MKLHQHFAIFDPRRRSIVENEIIYGQSGRIQDLRFVRANKFAGVILGTTAKELKGRLLSEVSHPLTDSEISGINQIIAQNEPLSSVRLDQRGPTWYSTVAFINHRGYLCSLNYDITGLKATNPSIDCRIMPEEIPYLLPKNYSTPQGSIKNMPSLVKCFPDHRLFVVSRHLDSYYCPECRRIYSKPFTKSFIGSFHNFGEDYRYQITFNNDGKIKTIRYLNGTSARSKLCLECKINMKYMGARIYECPCCLVKFRQELGLLRRLTAQ